MKILKSMNKGATQQSNLVSNKEKLISKFVTPLCNPFVFTFLYPELFERAHVSFI